MDHWRTKHSIKTWNTTLASNKFYDQRLLRLHDDRAPDRQVQTEEFWARLAEFEAATSELAREELEQPPRPWPPHPASQIASGPDTSPHNDREEGISPPLC